MAPSFGRSISFPLSPAKSARHVRSISLPCRSHPLLAHLHTHIAAVRVWAASTAAPSVGFAHVVALHDALAELLLLPEARAALHTDTGDRLLDAFLLLADAHRGFHETLLALKADVADVQAALRRRDAARLDSAARSQRRNDKDLARFAATTASLSSVAAAKTKCARLHEETEMAAALMDAAAASAAASAAVFSAVASMSASTSPSNSKKTAPFVAAFTRKSAAAPETTPVEELAQCIDDCESGSEMVFRSIVRTRVSLLNIRTPAI